MFFLSFIAGTGAISGPAVCQNWLANAQAAIFRADCGVEASQPDFYLSEEKCVNFGCCWDPTDFGYETFVPICYKTPIPTTVTATKDTTTTVVTTTTTTPLTLQEIILIKDIFIQSENDVTEIEIVKSTEKPKPMIPIVPVNHEDLVISYRKQTCQQVAEAFSGEMREKTLEKMKCDTVDYVDYDSESDPNLQQSSEAGMKLLMEKFQKQSEKEGIKLEPKILAGGMTSIINTLPDPAEQTAQLIDQKIKKYLRGLKEDSDACKTVEAQFARKRKTSFSSNEKSKIEEVCGRVPDSKYMLGLMTSLKIHLLDDDEDELTWRLPEESLEIEYVEWDVMQRCIDRSDYYIENFNCFEKSWNIYDQKTCSDNGCIYYDEECFFCQEAFENAEMVKSALEATSLSNPECSAKAEQRRECEGFDDDEGDSMVEKMIKMQMQSNPSMAFYLEKKNKQKCEDLGCCYEKNEKAMLMQMMLAQQRTAARAAEQAKMATANPMEAMMNAMKNGGDLDDIKTQLKSSMGLSGLTGGLSSIPDAAANPMNALFMHKLGAFEKSSCYAKIDMSTNSDHECLPKLSDAKCGQSDSPDNSTDQPWNVVITDTNDNIECGGVLVCSSWFLTTAGCLKKFEKKDANGDLKLGEFFAFTDVNSADNFTDATQLSVRRVVFHDLYDPSARYSRQRLIHDIAAVQIKSLDNQPICLPDATANDLKTGDTAYSLGYGRFSDQATDAAGPLKVQSFEIESKSSCEKMYGSINFDRSLCGKKSSNTHNMPICHGDKGGALATYANSGWTLNGLISGGPDDCDLTDTPVVFLSIQKELKWIKETTNNCCRATLF